MATEIKKEIELEIAYVLFIDIVGYSKLVIDRAAAVARTAQSRSCASTEHFHKAAEANKPADHDSDRRRDGAGFLQYTRKRRWNARWRSAARSSEHPELKLRMGIHSGPVSGVVDVSGRANIAGAGINIAQRVMDCGDAGHILLSKHVAEDLEQYGHWKRHLHDLGEAK